MTPIAVVILAHNDPAQVRRLIGALPDLPVFLHCDARTSAEVAARMFARLPPRVSQVERMETSLASWSLVDAELRALRAALKRTAAQHIVVASGADYPLIGVDELARNLLDWTDRSFFWNVPLPYERWSSPRNPDGGFWRLRYRFLTRRNHIVYVKGKFPLRSPIRRSVPAGVEPRASSQWKIYARHHAERLLDVVDRRPDLIKFWRQTLVPDETFAASMLGSPRIVGSDGLEPCELNAWHTQWPQENTYHPAWLGNADFATLRRVREDDSEHRKWFARKFSTSQSQDVLDRIDSELRV